MATGNVECVVVAVDSREESMKALRWALDNLRLRPAVAAAAAAAAAAGAPIGILVILHVQTPLLSMATAPNPGSVPFGGPSDVEAHQQQITDAIFMRALDICAGRNDKICKATANFYADVLVIGCHSMGPIKKTFLGSVSDYCVNHASCLVLVIKGI